MTDSAPANETAGIVALVLEGRHDEAEALVDLMDIDELRRALLGAAEIVGGVIVEIVARVDPRTRPDDETAIRELRMSVAAQIRAAATKRT
ncbi:hypothetical protein [Tsukamurella sp. USMM236]|uniref:hypothetical protein n=1 Tax=Tsukamurella sp. USMM236 TaxID=3081301 RepID=UPI00301B498F